MWCYIVSSGQGEQVKESSPPASFRFIDSSSGASFVYTKIDSLAQFSLFGTGACPSSVALLLGGPDTSRGEGAAVDAVMELIAGPLRTDVPSAVFSGVFFVLPVSFYVREGKPSIGTI